MSNIRERLTFANVMSVTAVFIALGGSAWAISANSVGSKQIKPKAVKNSDLADNAVTSPKVADGSLLSQDFGAGQIPAGPRGEQGIQGLRGEQGIQGLRGIDGAQGIQGPPGPTGEQGIQGLRGIDGAQGIQGPPGPTVAVAKGSANPVATPEFPTSVSTPISVPAAGEVLVMFDSSNIIVGCSAGNADLGLYVDGTAVPGTDRFVANNVGRPVAAFGVTAAPIQPGNHTIRLGADCPAGNFQSIAYGDNSIGGVLLGP